MNDLVTRWDWICLGICIGVLMVFIGQGIQRLMNSWFLTNDLKLQRALAQDILKMKEKLDA